MTDVTWYTIFRPSYTSCKSLRQALGEKFELTLSLNGANIKGATASAIIGNVIDRTQTSLDIS